MRRPFRSFRSSEISPRITNCRSPHRSRGSGSAWKETTEIAQARSSVATSQAPVSVGCGSPMKVEQLPSERKARHGLGSVWSLAWICLHAWRFVMAVCGGFARRLNRSTGLTWFRNGMWFSAGVNTPTGTAPGPTSPSLPIPRGSGTPGLFFDSGVLTVWPDREPEERALPRLQFGLWNSAPPLRVVPPH